MSDSNNAAQDGADSSAPESQEAIDAHMRWAEVNAESRGFLHAPEGTNPHYHYAPRHRQESPVKERKMTRSEYLERRQQRWARNPRPDTPSQPVEDYSKGGGESSFWDELWRFLKWW